MASEYSIPGLRDDVLDLGCNILHMINQSTSNQTLVMGYDENIPGRCACHV